MLATNAIGAVFFRFPHCQASAALNIELHIVACLAPAPQLELAGDVPRASRARHASKGRIAPTLNQVSPADLTGYR